MRSSSHTHHMCTGLGSYHFPHRTVCMYVYSFYHSWLKCFPLHYKYPLCVSEWTVFADRSHPTVVMSHQKKIFFFVSTTNHKPIRITVMESLLLEPIFHHSMYPVLLCRFKSRSPLSCFCSWRSLQKKKKKNDAYDMAMKKTNCI